MKLTDTEILENYLENHLAKHSITENWQLGVLLEYGRYYHEQVKNYDSLDSVSNSLVADIRNKLSPINNLCAMLRNAPRNLTDDEDINNMIFSEIKQCEKSIEYLSNL